MADFSWPTFLASLVGSGATAWMLVRGLGRHLAERWLARYKGELDKELELYRDTLQRKRGRIEAELGQRTFVSRTQFETEFDALKECFRLLGKLRLSVNSLRPFIESGIPQSEQEQQKVAAIRVELATEQFNCFVEAAETLYPFIPADVYEQFRECIAASRMEIEEFKRDGFSPSGYTNQERNEKWFSGAYFKAADLTRKRFTELSIASE